LEGFRDNGQLWIRGNCKDGKQEGLWETFDEDGNSTGTETYKDGKLVDENLDP
jgi:antitoxin component YwqK of YwqJK toxin-antitoxin module